MDNKLPPLNSLRAFEMTGRHLNVARAAHALGVSPGAVSQQIRLLEKWLGCRLFIRGNRGLRFTDAGKDYHLSVATSIDGVRAATSKICRPEVRQKFTISATTSFTMKWLLPRLADFRERWPEVDISVSTVETVNTFLQSDGDVGIRYSAGDHPGMNCWELIRDELILVAAPSLADKLGQEFDVADLKAYPLLFDPHPSVISDYPSWETYFQGHGVEAGDDLNIHKFSVHWMVIEAAINGQGLALAKTCLVENDLKRGNLVQLSPERLKLQSGYYLVCLPENSSDSIVQSLKNWLPNVASKTASNHQLPKTPLPA